MRLTLRCSPQPQCKSHFLKPWLYHGFMKLPANCHCSLKPDDAKALIAHSIYTYSQGYIFWRDVHLEPQKQWYSAVYRQNCDSEHSWDRNKEVEKSTHISSNISVYNAQRKAREKSPLDNEWPALYHRCITVWCGTERRHSSHSKKTPCWFISCLLNEPSLVRVLKGLCLLGLNYALSPPVSQRSDLNLQI